MNSTCPRQKLAPSPNDGAKSLKLRKCFLTPKCRECRKYTSHGKTVDLRCSMKAVVVLWKCQIQGMPHSLPSWLIIPITVYQFILRHHCDSMGFWTNLYWGGVPPCAFIYHQYHTTSWGLRPTCHRRIQGTTWARSLFHLGHYGPVFPLYSWMILLLISRNCALPCDRFLADMETTINIPIWPEGLELMGHETLTRHNIYPSSSFDPG